MKRSLEVAQQADRISLEQFIEASSNAVMRALETRRPDASGEGIGLPTTTIGVIIRPPEPSSAEPLQTIEQLRLPSATMDAVMQTARASADIHNTYLSRVREQYADAKGDRVAVAAEALDRLEAKGLIAAAEAAQFKALLQEASQPGAKEAAIASSVRRLNMQMRSTDASPLALTLAGVVADSSFAEPDADVLTARGDKAKACVSEGLVGAILGAELAGSAAGVTLPVVGAIPGAVVGAVVGGVAGCALGVLASVL